MAEAKARIGKFRKVVTEISFYLCVALILVMVFYPNGRAKQNNRRMACQSNLKQIALSVRQYTVDFDGRFPLVAASKPRYGWADALQPYLQSTEIYQCPIEENSSQPDPTQPQYTDYWFNARVSQKNQRQIFDPTRTITFGDGNDGNDMTDARYYLLSIPSRWRRDEKSPLYRHLGGANFAFADGHVKWFHVTGWKSHVSHHHGATFLLGSGKVKN